MTRFLCGLKHKGGAANFKLPPDRETMYAFALAFYAIAYECLSELLVDVKDDALVDELEARIATTIKSSFAENMSYETENAITEKSLFLLDATFKDMVREIRR